MSEEYFDPGDEYFEDEDHDSEEDSSCDLGQESVVEFLCGPSTLNEFIIDTIIYWMESARALRDYYLQNERREDYKQALAVAENRLSRLKLAQSQLRLNKGSVLAEEELSFEIKYYEDKIKKFMEMGVLFDNSYLASLNAWLSGLQMLEDDLKGTKTKREVYGVKF